MQFLYLSVSSSDFIDVEESGRGLFQSTIPAFAWRGWGKSRNPEVLMVDVLGDIRTDISQIWQERHHFSKFARYRPMQLLKRMN
jgi:hypothetical protein